MTISRKVNKLNHEQDLLICNLTWSLHMKYACYLCQLYAWLLMSNFTWRLHEVCTLFRMPITCLFIWIVISPKPPQHWNLFFLKHYTTQTQVRFATWGSNTGTLASALKLYKIDPWVLFSLIIITTQVCYETWLISTWSLFMPHPFSVVFISENVFSQFNPKHWTLKTHNYIPQVNIIHAQPYGGWFSEPWMSRVINPYEDLYWQPLLPQNCNRHVPCLFSHSK